MAAHRRQVNLHVVLVAGLAMHYHHLGLVSPRLGCPACRSLANARLMCISPDCGRPTRGIAVMCGGGAGPRAAPVTVAAAVAAATAAVAAAAALSGAAVDAGGRDRHGSGGCGGGGVCGAPPGRALPLCLLPRVVGAGGGAHP